MELLVLSVNVSQPKPLGTIDGQIILSAIAKQPVDTPEIHINTTNLDGDRQADLSVHGGVDKAVYAYSADHWTWWETEHHFHASPGSFGENLTLAGAVETHVHIGDRFEWGSALLEISQPRQPCFKLQMHAARDDIAAHLTISGRCGWYLRVIEQGVAPVASPLVRTVESDGPTVRDTFMAAFNRRIDPRERKQISTYPALSTAWRATLQRRP